MTMKRGFLWIMVMWLLLGGCDVTGQPEVELKDARLVKADAEKASFELLFGLRNPFPVDVFIPSITYRLELSGMTFFSGHAAPSETVKARAKSDFSFSTEIRYAEALFSLIDMTLDAEIPYRISGSFAFKTPVGDRRIDFVHEGSFANPFTAATDK